MRTALNPPPIWRNVDLTLHAITCESTTRGLRPRSSEKLEVSIRSKMTVSANETLFLEASVIFKRRSGLPIYGSQLLLILECAP